MVTRRSRRTNYAPLIVEPHPNDYNGYPFITLIQHRDKHILTVVDNADDKNIGAFVLDLCGPVGLNEEYVISLVSEWYDVSSERYPISIEFSRLNVIENMSKIFRNFNIDFVTRVIGPLPKFNMTEVKSIKRRKRKPVPAGVQVRNLVKF